jgi:hypothetical protein
MQIFMSASDLIAILALLVSAIAVYFARSSAQQAKHANQIALKEERYAIYSEVKSFQNHLQIPSQERLYAFDEKAIQPAKIYLSAAVYRKLKNIHHKALLSHVELKVLQTPGRIRSNFDSGMLLLAYRTSVEHLLDDVIKAIEVESNIHQTVLD